jgi:DNA-directed RNA polymerase specialized sigma24 family protein
MVNANEQFHALMEQVLAGSEVAAKELFDSYGSYLLYAIRRRMDRRIRSKFDSSDIAQDVWKSFFAEPLEKRTFTTPDDLVAFLTRLAQNKIADVARQRLKAKKYNVKREQSLDDSTRFDKDALAADQATPSQIVMGQEEWGEFLRKQPLVYRRIFMLMREGKSSVEIAQEMGINARVVRRVIDRVTAGRT